MLRKTISPIIYFQQIGRLLSFSNRNNNLKIVDLVNNIQNHKVIYNLYNDIYTKAKELKKIDKKNEEIYNNILENFKIADYAATAYKVKDEIKERLTIKSQ